MDELTAQQQIERLQHELDAVYGSSSYNVGRAVTWLPRRLRDGLQYTRKNGVAGSIRYLRTAQKYNKLSGSKDYAYWACLQPKDYEEALTRWFEENTGNKLDLRHPKTFNEKSQWLKLYDDRDRRTLLSDKYLVRDWVKQRIGEEYLVPLLGVWDKFDDIDFDKLPDRFALKANHGSSWNVIVPDKAAMDKADAKRKFDTWMQLNYTYLMGGLELQYEHIRPRIIAEQYIENNGGDLYDYKFFCFDGVVKYIKFVCDRYTGGKERMVFFDTDWNLQPFTYIVEYTDDPVPRPRSLELMIELATKLSQGMPAVRVDLYELPDGTVKFGEMTFTSYGGIPPWRPAEYDRFMGDLIHLPGVDD